MRFQMRRALEAAQAADPDPRTAPEDVQDVALIRANLTLRNSDTIAGRILLAAEGTAAQTITVDLFAEDDTGVDRQATMPVNQVPTPAERAARRFYLIATGVVVTVGEFTEVTANVPMPGTMYVRVTTAPAAASSLLVAFAN